MASSAADRIRAELFGPQSIPDNPVSILDSISELREMELRAADARPRRGNTSVTTCNIAGLSGEWIVSSGANSVEATILFLHGGGYILGSCATHRNIASILAVKCYSQ